MESRIDLEKDKSDLELGIDFGTIPVRYNDSLFLELQKRPLQGREKRINHFLLLYTNEINIYYHDRTISQLHNSGGFGLIRDQNISDAILDYDIHIRETRRYIESSRINHHVNSEILHHRKILELYRIEHFRESTIAHKNDMKQIPYPSDLKLLSYEELDIKTALNSFHQFEQVEKRSLSFLPVPTYEVDIAQWTVRQCNIEAPANSGRYRFRWYTAPGN